MHGPLCVSGNVALAVQRRPQWASIVYDTSKGILLFLTGIAGEGSVMDL